MGITNVTIIDSTGMVNKDSLLLDRFNKNMIWIKRFYDKGGKLVAGKNPTGAGRTFEGGFH